MRGVINPIFGQFRCVCLEEMGGLLTDSRIVLLNDGHFRLGELGFHKVGRWVARRAASKVTGRGLGKLLK